MAEIEITNFYWFNNPASNNDKVWGVFRIVEEGAFDRFYCFWGRRGSDIGKSLKFLKFGSEIPSNASKYDKDWYTREAKGEANSKLARRSRRAMSPFLTPISRRFILDSETTSSSSTSRKS